MTSTAAIMSLAVILVWLRGEPANERHAWFDLGLVFVTIPLSWAFIRTIFTLHYAHEYYGEHRGEKRIRRIVMFHSIIAFFFNVTLLALAMNLVGDAIQNG
jgi:uncharacterized membrane protein